MTNEMIEDPGHYQTPRIEMCLYYTTIGYPNFRPACEKGIRYGVGLKCHSKRKDCKYYEPSEG